MLKFDIITEADARTLDIGSTVELAAGGHVTPLAKDTLAARRVTVVGAGSRDAGAASALVPASDIRRVAIGNDHTGVAMKRAIVQHLRGRGLAVTDLGTDGTASVDYPDIAGAVALAVQRKEADAGIVIDGAGIGSAIAANKVRGVRAAMCPDETIARYSREHNGANVMTLGSTLLSGPDAALRIVDVWLGTAMREERYIRRLAKIKALEDRAAREGLAEPSTACTRSREQQLTARGGRGPCAVSSSRGFEAEPRPRMLNPQDLQRLIDIITEEVIAAQGVRPASSRCACHSVRSDCCPDRLRLMVDAGAARLGMNATGGLPSGVASMIDHTLLKPDATRAEIEKLCREAAEFKFATVCVNPVWVAESARLLRGSGVGVCSVVGFPLGATTADVKHYETRRAIFDGAREIDMVINVGALKSGDLRTVERDIEAVVEPCRECGVISKVIIEAALLNDEEKVTACTLSKAAGADFVKTSTGFGPGGATAADVALMRRVVGAEMGVKAAGGVRDLEGLRAMVAAGATRVGASAGVKIVQESKGQKPAAAAPSGY